MIVKKMPILQGFPDFETVKKLSNSVSFDCGNALFFMISKPPDYHDIPLFYI